MGKIAKKILILLVMLFTTISFCACSTTRLETVYNDDGSIEERLYVTIDKDAVGENFAEIKSKIIEYAQLEVEIERKNFVDQADNFIFRNKIKILKTELIDEENFMVGLWFNDQKTYNKFYDLSTKNTAELKQEKHFFYTKFYQTGSTMLSHTKLEAAYQRVYEKITTDYPQFVGMEKQNEMRYTMVTDTRREHSNADIVEKKDGNYYHTWIMNDSRQQITIYFIIANRANWILVCLGVGLLICAILCAVGLILIKKQKRKKDESKSS